MNHYELQGIPNNSITYSSPFSSQWPMTPYCVPPTTIKCTPNPRTNPPRGFYFDTANGDVIVTPTKHSILSKKYVYNRRSTRMI